MKQKNAYTLLLIGALTLCGCDTKNESEMRQPNWKEKEALLLHSEKEIVRHDFIHSFFYFDTDGNPDTAEEMLHLISPNEDAHLRYFNNAKIGTYKTLKEWENALTGEKDYIQWTAIHQDKKLIVTPGRYKEKE